MSLGEMDELRYLYCKHYPGCLHLHARLDKQWFSCGGCRQYKPLYLDPEDIIEEALNVGEFLHALFFGLPEEEEWTLTQDTKGTVYVKVPLDLIRSFQNALFLFAGNAQAMINIGNQLIQLGDDLKQRITAGEEDEILEP